MNRYAIAFLFHLFACTSETEVPLKFRDVEILNDTYLPTGLTNASEDALISNETLQTEVTHLDCDCGPYGDCFFLWAKKTCHCFRKYAAKLVDSDLTCVPCDCGVWERSCTYKDHKTKLCTCLFGASPDNGICRLCECGIGGSYTCSFDEAGTRKCDCSFGYELVDSKCKDIDECKKPSLNDCPLETDCINLIGSYKCKCKKGFDAIYLSDKCEDIDECVRWTACDSNSEDCINTYGSYRCFCKHDYTFDIRTGNCKMNSRGWRAGYIVLIVIIVIAILGTVLYAKRRHYMQ